jgi:hypothetical protein
MSWNHDLGKVTVDAADPTLFTLELVNEGPLPINFVLTEVSPSDPNALPLQDKVVVSMVTRRSTVNPTEVVKLRIKLPIPPSNFDAKEHLDFGLITDDDSFAVGIGELQEAEAAGGFRPATLAHTSELKHLKKRLRRT